MKIWKWQTITIFFFTAFMLNSCDGGNTTEANEGDLIKRDFEFSTDFTEEDWVLGDLPKEKMVLLKEVKQFSFRPENQEPTFDYLNVAKHEDKLYIQNNYDGKISRIDMKTLELENNLYPQHAGAIYEDEIKHITIDEKGRLILPGKKNLFILDGDELTKLQNTYMLDNFCLGYADKIYSLNTRQQFSPGYEAFDLYDYQLNHLGSRFENPLWDDISGKLVASSVMLRRKGDKLLLSSSCHSKVSLYNFADGKHREVEIAGLDIFKQFQDYNYNKMREDLREENYKPTFIGADLLDDEMFLLTRKGRCLYIINTDLMGRLKKVYLIKIMNNRYNILNMQVVRHTSETFKVFMYCYGSKKDGSRVFPICVLEPEK